jgi:hypothetical protein
MRWALGNRCASRPSIDVARFHALARLASIVTVRDPGKRFPQSGRRFW